MVNRRNPSAPIIDGIESRIPLTRGKYAIVDTMDLPLVSHKLWRAINEQHLWYATSGSGQKGYSQVMMHRIIAAAPKGVQVDHINGDGLDNRRANLRLCTSLENSRNRRISISNTSGYKGVHWVRHLAKWEARITIRGERFSLGCYVCAADAARAYNDRAIVEFGEFAKLNEVR